MLALLGPETAHSPNAQDINTLYWVMFVITALIAIAINGGLIWLIANYRAKRDAAPRRLRSRRRPQLVLAGGLGVLATALFVLGVAYTESASKVEASGPDGLQASSLRTAQSGLALPVGGPDPLRITATGQQWLWRYEYPDPSATAPSSASTGASEGQTFSDVFSFFELIVPVDTAVVLTVESTDVLHRWWVPGLGTKVDAVPGDSLDTWFKADEEGTYDGASYLFSGAAFAAMRTRVRVVSVAEYQAWLAQQAEDIAAAQTFVQEQAALRVGATGSEGEG